ncbi:MAG: glycoside hydrolase family 2 [Bacteroidetes bacterium]|nr:glycoside hydrolase family 2 [Bacteroidota bacterium]
MKKSTLLLFFLCTLLFGNAQKTVIQNLSGIDKDHTIDWDFFCTKNRNSGKWSKIPVPSQWEQLGFGGYNYGHDKNKFDEQGLYKYRFDIPKSWKGNAVYIVFDGVMTDVEVKINGKLAGPIHQGGYYQFKYDITKLLKYGSKNILEATVSKVSADASVQRAELTGDYWVFGGIFRPVYLEMKPATHIDRIAIDARADGSFSADLFLSNIPSNTTLEAQIQTLTGENIGQPIQATASANQEKVTLKEKIEKPKQWSAEFPNRYQVVVALKNKKQIVHTITQPFGFRTIEVRKHDGLYVNGVRVILKGVNRHCSWPETGRTLSKALSIIDANLIKDMNMNAVRMSHYNPDIHFLDVCDSLGLYILDEVTGWQAAYDTKIGKEKVKETVLRDVNHPCILFWDNGNEGGWNRNLDGDFSLYDPQNRVVLHPWENFNGINTNHYPDYNLMFNETLYGQDIYMPTEFMHGLHDGGHGAGLDDFWNQMLLHPYLGGGFLWVLADEGIVRTDKNGYIDVYGTNAPDGIVGPHREKEGSFYAIKEIWSPIYIPRKVITPSFNGRLEVENRYNSTNLSQCTFSWKLVTFPSPTDKTIVATVNASGKPKPFALEPNAKDFLNLNLPETWKESDALYLTAYDPYQREIFTWSWALKTSKNIAERSMIKTSETNSELRENEDSLIIKAGKIQYHFDKKSGYLEKVINSKGNISLSGGPTLVEAALKLKQIKQYKEGNNQIVEVVYDGVKRFKVKWSLAPDRPAKLEYEFQYQKEVNIAGITFNYPEEQVTGMKWLGRGPYHVWKNRLKGMELSVWHKYYNDAITGEVWQYPEFKGYHSELYWATIENKQSSFTVYTETDGLFLQMLKPSLPKARNDNTTPAFPEGNLGFLTGISAIGTKFQPATDMGPQSQKNKMTNMNPIKGTLWFDFRVSSK